MGRSLLTTCLGMILLASTLTSCFGYLIYQARIPNGNNVPHPCKPNYKWEGVGHQAVVGGSTRNPFGIAFKAAGATWNKALCEADSDGDGKKNGEELGDPDCIWSEGAVPSNTSELSHPGVCEPTESANCKERNTWGIDCSDGSDFYCEGIGDPETLNVTLKFDRTPVPAQKTTYMCQSFAIPSDRVYHLFAAKPEIDNAFVMHHTIVYGCKDDNAGYNTPQPCGMTGGNSCSSTMLSAWAIGSNVECHKNGILVGKGHFTRVLIEQHWNNPESKAGYTDASGMTLFLTPKLRPFNVGFLITGQEFLTIPAGRDAYTDSGVCPGYCVTERLKEPIYITMAHLHMHYLGSAGRIEQWRDGKLLKYWFNEQQYNYGLPVFNAFDPPLELRPGDEVKTICTFKSTLKSEITYFGQATNDEMCYGFMNYYPAEAGPDECIAWKQYDACQLKKYGNSTEIPSPTTTYSTTTSPACTPTSSMMSSSIPTVLLLIGLLSIAK